MRVFHQLPPELFYQIALHLPLTKDVFALSLTNSCIRRALSTPALFKSRLALQGWDVSSWKEEDDAAQSPGDIKRWMHIDHTYCRTAQLFDEATADGFFFSTFVPDPHKFPYKDVQWDGAGRVPRLDNRSPDSSLCLVYDGKKSVNWLQKLSRVLPLFVTHHRGGNIGRITEAKYCDVFRAYATVANSLCTVVWEITRDDGPGPRVLSSQYGWFEPICFSLIALLIQCDAATVVSIFTNTCRTAIHSPQSTFTAFTSTAANRPAIVPWDAQAPEHISECYFAVFFLQTILLAKLHLDAARRSSLQPLLLPPSLPYFDARSSSFYYSSNYSCYSHDAPVEPGAAASESSTSIPLRPWLHDGLAGTPFASFSSTTSRSWAGYYTITGLAGVGLDPPMHLELRSVGTDADAVAGFDSDRVHIYGEGQDGVGTFTVVGTCKKGTGVVRAIKAYATHSWEWRGVLTPFGMAGIWGPGSRGGWWWIWPREWSPTTGRRRD